MPSSLPCPRVRSVAREAGAAPQPGACGLQRPRRPPREWLHPHPWDWKGWGPTGEHSTLLQ